MKGKHIDDYLIPLPINNLLTLQQLITKRPYSFNSMKIVCSWCERVIAGPTVGIEDDDYVVPLICKSCCEEVFEEGEPVNISKAYAAIQTKSGRYFY
jgi:hypothetical protein